MDLEKTRFGKVEAVFILINIISIQIFLGFPRRMAELGGTAGWIIPIYTLVLSLIFFSVISKLYNRFDGKDILILQSMPAAFWPNYSGIDFLDYFYI